MKKKNHIIHILLPSLTMVSSVRKDLGYISSSYVKDLLNRSVALLLWLFSVHLQMLLTRYLKIDDVKPTSDDEWSRQFSVSRHAFSLLLQPYNNKISESCINQEWMTYPKHRGSNSVCMFTFHGVYLYWLHRINNGCFFRIFINQKVHIIIRECWN